METANLPTKPRPRPTPSWLYVVIILGLFCGIGLGFVLRSYSRQLEEEWNRMEASGQLTTGIITGRSFALEDNKDVTYHIEINGQTHITTEMVSENNWAVLDKGDTVNVVYLDENGKISTHIAGNTYPQKIIGYYAIGSWFCTIIPGGLLGVIALMTYLNKRIGYTQKEKGDL